MKIRAKQQQQQQQQEFSHELHVKTRIVWIEKRNSSGCRAAQLTLFLGSGRNVRY